MPDDSVRVCLFELADRVMIEGVTHLVYVTLGLSYRSFADAIC